MIEYKTVHMLAATDADVQAQVEKLEPVIVGAQFCEEHGYGVMWFTTRKKMEAVEPMPPGEAADCITRTTADMLAEWGVRVGLTRVMPTAPPEVLNVVREIFERIQDRLEAERN